jgi:hypothetical protein
VNSWIFDNDGLVCVELREDNDALVEQGQEVNVDIVQHHRCPEESIFPNYDYRARARIYHLFLVFCSFSAENTKGNGRTTNRDLLEENQCRVRMVTSPSKPEQQNGE